MKMMVSKIIFCFLLITGFLNGYTNSVSAGQVSMMTYYPAPTGIYDRIRLIPQSSLPTPCQAGTLMFEESSSVPKFCRDNGTSANWETLSGGVWTQDGNYIYPNTTLTNPDLFLGIGTSTPDFKLHLEHDGGILATNSSGGTLRDPPPQWGWDVLPFLMWFPKQSSFLAGSTYPYYIDVLGTTFGAVTLGQFNRARGNYSTALGGFGNDITGEYFVISSGSYNGAFPGNYSGSAWSRYTEFAEDYSYVSGFGNGEWLDNPSYRGPYLTLLGGSCNFINTEGSVIAGGHNHNNIWSGSPPDCGGPPNDYYGIYTTLGGGRWNYAKGDYATSAGSAVAYATGDYSASAGGHTRNSTGQYSAIGGGLSLYTQGDYSVVGGGNGNNNGGNAGAYSSIAGGVSNFAYGQYSTIGGGRNNSTNGTHATIAGGGYNQANGNYSVVAGGNYVINNGDYSWAGGQFLTLTANADRTFAWGHGTSSGSPITIDTADAFIVASGSVGIRDNNPGANVEINRNGAIMDDYLAISTGDYCDDFGCYSGVPSGNVFVIKANGNVGFGEPNPSYPLHFASGAYLSAGGVFTDVSSRTKKERIQSLAPDQALEAFKKLEPVSFTYKNAPDEHHIGFIAEDVPELVARPDHKSLSPMEFTSLLTAVVKQQREQILEQEKILKELREDLATIEKKN